MTLLSICQSATDQVGLDDRPSQIANSNKREARRLLALANRAGNHLQRLHRWTMLTLEHEITTLDSVDSYALPADLDRMMADTAWDRTNNWRMHGQKTARQWQSRLSTQVATSDTRLAWRLIPNAGTNEFTIDPIPGAGTELAFNYHSVNWAESAAGTGQSKYLADDDVARIPEYLVELELIWRLLASHQHPYFEEKASSDAEANRAIGHDLASDWIVMGSRPRGDVNIPEGSFG